MSTIYKGNKNTKIKSKEHFNAVFGDFSSSIYVDDCAVNETLIYWYLHIISPTTHQRVD